MNRAQRRQQERKVRKGLMRYLKHEQFAWENDKGETKSFVIEEDGEKHDATVSEVLLTLARAWQPSQGQQLTIDEIDHLNKTKRILSKPPEASGFHEVESADWDVFKKTVLWVAPQVNFYFLAPQIRVYLEAVTDKKPETPAHTNGNSEAPIPEKEASVAT